MDSYHHGHLRQDLLDRARRALDGSPGAELPSLRELARQAGVSPTAVYHHFSSREALLAGVAASLLSELSQAWEGLSLEQMGPAYVEFFRTHPSALGLVFGQAIRRNPAVRELQDGAYRLLVSKLPPRVDGSPNHEAGLALWALVHGLAHLYAAQVLGADPVECPGGPDLWYQAPGAVIARLGPGIAAMLDGA